MGFAFISPAPSAFEARLARTILPIAIDKAAIKKRRKTRGPHDRGASARRRLREKIPPGSGRWRQAGWRAPPDGAAPRRGIRRPTKAFVPMSSMRSRGPRFSAIHAPTTGSDVDHMFSCGSSFRATPSTTTIVFCSITSSTLRRHVEKRGDVEEQRQKLRHRDLIGGARMDRFADGPDRLGEILDAMDV